MSAPERRSKWDQGPHALPQWVPPSSHVSDNSGDRDNNASKSADQETAAKNDPGASAAARAAAFLSTNLSGGPTTSSASSTSAPTSQGWLPPGHPGRVAAPLFSEEVNINGCRPEIRYVMTSQDTWDTIEEETGVKIVKRGTFRQSDSSASVVVEGMNPDDKPLHLYVTGDSQEKVDKACAKLKVLLERPSTTPSGLLMNKVYVPFAADADPAFSLPGKIIGPSGNFVRHIQNATGCKVHLRGKGSSYMEANTRQEAEEALHLFITGPTESQVQKAKELSEQLIASVKRKYDAYLADKKAGGTGFPGHAPHHASNAPSTPYSNSNTSSAAPSAAPSAPSTPYGAHGETHLRSPQRYPPPTPSSYDSTTTTPVYTPQRSPSGPRHGYEHSGSGYHPGGSFSRDSSTRDLRPPPPPGAPSSGPGTRGSSPNRGMSPRAGDNRPPPPPGPPTASYTQASPTVPTIDYAAQQAMAAAAYGYAEWTPEAIAAYYAYYGMAVPTQMVAAGYAASEKPAPPPNPQTARSTSGSTNGANQTSARAVQPAEEEMDMADDSDDEYIVASAADLPLATVHAKAKRHHSGDAGEDGADWNTNAKRAKQDEHPSKPPPPSTDKPFWASTSSTRGNVLAPYARAPES